MPYPEEMIAWMRAELADNGVAELKTAEAVDKFLADKTGVAMVVVNSVCGCAAGAARPGILKALQHTVKPDKVGTVFAGNDTDAVANVRARMPQVPPSSPSVYIFKDGQPVSYVPRHVFEGGNPEAVAKRLVDEFEKVRAKQTV
ncbi:MAG: BrxA/BrxB family bacilliredoxin [Planctomycetes bacterium]|jgi:putative YphP/YqiW family bacilliredoxin|nr:BrxA/BrxB family bacilliredoxin [Planctomycetota bacterium]MCL4731225.1 BrxA/BrxB family bacilliredoxin [Planctomycetota bacterium]